MIGLLITLGGGGGGGVFMYGKVGKCLLGNEWIMRIYVQALVL